MTGAPFFSSVSVRLQDCPLKMHPQLADRHLEPAAFTFRYVLRTVVGPEPQTPSFLRHHVPHLPRLAEISQKNMRLRGRLPGIRPVRLNWNHVVRMMHKSYWCSDHGRPMGPDPVQG